MKQRVGVGGGGAGACLQSISCSPVLCSASSGAVTGPGDTEQTENDTLTEMRNALISFHFESLQSFVCGEEISQLTLVG